MDETYRLGDSGAAVEDIQQRLSIVGLLAEDDVNGTFDEATKDAVSKFASMHGRPDTEEVDPKLWAVLVDATYSLGDRTLFLKMPYFHGHDVVELQKALGALGFFYGAEDGIFGAHTEDALRKFQMNLGLPSDGIAGAYTFSEIHNLEHSWVGKESIDRDLPLGFARASDVLEKNALCLFGTDEFTRSVASRMSNLALATNPVSKIVSADMLSTIPDDDVLLVQISMERGNDSTPTVLYADDGSLSSRLDGAVVMAKANSPKRIRVVLPGYSWMEAGEERTAQHFAITLLDAICQSL